MIQMSRWIFCFLFYGQALFGIPFPSFSPQAFLRCDSISSLWVCVTWLPCRQLQAQQVSQVSGAAASPTAQNTIGSNVDDPQAILEAQIKSLIELLGSEHFASRRRAQMELELMGLDAFEALQEAFEHPDPEVAAAARYLINSAQVEWATENDPPLVREILQNYDARTMAQRKTLMDRLGNLPKREGWAPLCRIAKFEPSNSLSKYAAIILMNKRKSLLAEDRTALIQLIDSEIGRSRRAGADWLRKFAVLVGTQPADPKGWYVIAENEHALLDSGSAETFTEIVQAMYEWTALLGEENQQRDEALRMARGAVRIVGNEPMGLRNASYWVIDHGFAELVEEMHLENQVLFSKNAELTYCLAESYRARKMEEEAEEFAQVAFNNPSVGTSALRDPRDFRTSRAYSLQARGLFDWSEREFREAISKLRLLDVAGLKARYFLGEMLHDLGRNEDAAKLWDEILNELEATGETYRQQLQGQLDLGGIIDPAAVISQAYLYQGLWLAEQGDIVQARIKLNHSFEYDSDNADVLIAMHRLEGDQQWRMTVLQRISSCAGYFQSQMIQLEQEMEGSGMLAVIEARKKLATMNNQYAWLISNTEGDFQQALNCSLRSLELEPDAPGYIDTLGRCYYALGDFENAVKQQRRAVELDPFAMAMKRQLKLFETALQQQKDANKK